MSNLKKQKKKTFLTSSVTSRRRRTIMCYAFLKEENDVRRKQYTYYVQSVRVWKKKQTTFT